MPIETAREARERARSLGADCAVAVGGGSTTGLGKAIALDSGLPILAIPTIWILALASLANYVTRYAINSWGPLYMQEARGFDEVASGTMLMISTLAGVAGSILYGFISDTFFKARRPPANLLFALRGSP